MTGKTMKSQVVLNLAYPLRFIRPSGINCYHQVKEEVTVTERGKNSERESEKEGIIHSLLYRLKQYISLERLLLKTRHKDRDRERQNKRQEEWEE